MEFLCVNQRRSVLVSAIACTLLLTIQCRPQVPQEQNMYGPTISLDSIAFPDPALRPVTPEIDVVEATENVISYKFITPSNRDILPDEGLCLVCIEKTTNGFTQYYNSRGQKMSGCAYELCPNPSYEVCLQISTRPGEIELRCGSEDEICGIMGSEPCAYGGAVQIYFPPDVIPTLSNGIDDIKKSTEGAIAVTAGYTEPIQQLTDGGFEEFTAAYTEIVDPKAGTELILISSAPTVVPDVPVLTESATEMIGLLTEAETVIPDVPIITDAETVIPEVPVLTEGPDVVTKIVAIVTDPTTEAPKVVTEVVTEVTVTEVIRIVTEAPAIVTEVATEPVAIVTDAETTAPEIVTEAPEVVTEVPEVVTEAPEVVTEVPEVVTDSEAPEVITEAPEVISITEAPEVVTEAPEVITEAPEVVTEAPEIVTEAPEVVTEAPEIVLVVETSVVVTAKPDPVTKAKVLPVVTDAPEVVTKVVAVVTEAKAATDEIKVIGGEPTEMMPIDGTNSGNLKTDPTMPIAGGDAEPTDAPIPTDAPVVQDCENTAAGCPREPDNESEPTEPIIEEGKAVGGDAVNHSYSTLLLASCLMLLAAQLLN